MSEQNDKAVLDTVAPVVVGEKLAFHGEHAQRFADYFDRLVAEDRARNPSPPGYPHDLF